MKNIIALIVVSLAVMVAMIGTANADVGITVDTAQIIVVVGEDGTQIVTVTTPTGIFTGDVKLMQIDFSDGSPGFCAGVRDPEDYCQDTTLGRNPSENFTVSINGIETTNPQLVGNNIDPVQTFAFKYTNNKGTPNGNYKVLYEADWTCTGLCDSTGYAGYISADASILGRGSMETTGDNSPPIANPNGPYNCNEGSACTFNGGGSSDPDPGDSITLYEWDFDYDGIFTVDTSGATLTNPGHAYGDGNAVKTLALRVTDSHGAQSVATASVTIINEAPTAIFAATSPIDEGGSSTLSLTSPSDPSVADTNAGFHYSFACDGQDSSLASTYAAAGTASTASCTFNDNSDYTVKSRIFDKDDGYNTYQAIVTVNNVLPIITSTTGPSDPLALGGSASVTASFTDAGSLDTHTCIFSWDDGSSSPGTVTESGGSGSCTATRTYATAGVYTVGITVSDDDGGSATSKFEFAVVYEPSAGFVTGGGWINSPSGAYRAGPSLSGKANFGFVSKYQKGASVPTGETEFQFKVANFNFHSSSYDWLVVAGAKAQYKGSGTVNGAGNYGFLLTATDGQRPGGGGADKFRIKIWDNSNNGAIVYDNQLGASETADPTTVISGGSIVIHS